MISVTVIHSAVVDFRIHDTEQIAIFRGVDQPGKEHIGEQSADISMIEVVGTVPSDIIIKECVSPGLSRDTKNISIGVYDIQRFKFSTEHFKNHVLTNANALILAYFTFHGGKPRRCYN